MERILIVLREGLGLNFEAMRPALHVGAPIAIGRGGAVIADVLDDFPDVRTQRLQELRAQLGNDGHGHVVPRLDGSMAKCGGPRLCKTCEKEELLIKLWQHTDEASAAAVGAPSLEHIKLKPCAHCEGPPVPTVQLQLPPLGKAPRQEDYGDDGLAIDAYVFCHECGAQGPCVSEVIEDAQGYDDALAEAVRLWQQRDARHRDLYDGGEAEGLNLLPRPDREDEQCLSSKW